MSRVTSEIDAAAGTIAGTCRTTADAAAGGCAHFVCFAKRAAGAAVGAIGPRIDAGRRAFDLSCRTGALTRATLLAGLANVATSPAMLGIASLVDASSRAARETLVAQLFALTARAHGGRLASHAAAAAVRGVAQRLDTGAGALELALATHTARAAASLASGAGSIAAAAILAVALEMQAAAGAISKARRARRRTLAQAAHLSCRTSLAAAPTMSGVDIDADADTAAGDFSSSADHGGAAACAGTSPRARASAAH